MANCIQMKPLKKCGEVTLQVELDKRIFALNCIYCEVICLQIETFALHIEEEHAKELCAIDASVSQDRGDEIIDEYHEETLEYEPEFTLDDCSHSQKEVHTYSNHTFDDPLTEPSLMKSEVVEIRVATENKTIEEHILKPPCTDAVSSSDSDIDSEESEEESEANDITSENEKEVTLALISEYEKQRVLWDNSTPYFKKRIKREEAFTKITSAINKQLNVDIRERTVKQRIRKLRYKFRTELHNQQDAQHKEKEYNSVWYYDKLAFLSKTIKCKRRSKRGTKALANERSSLPLPNLTDAQNLHLIELYKGFPCLWDVQHIGYRFKNQRQDALDEMVEAVRNKMKLNINSDELQKKLYRIRYACTQEKHRQLQCERQEKVYKPICVYYKHISFLKDNVGPFKCSFCTQTFNGSDQYKIHKSQHDGSMPFTCPLCQRGFMKVGNCTVHLRRHTRDFPFECKVCSKRFATTTDVNVHMRYHTGDKPYFCEVCGQSFRTWTFFDAHMRRHQKRPTHQCNICPKAFYENNKLTEHMKAHLNIRDKVCNVCGKAFTSAKYLRQHKQIHADKKKYVCKICSKHFAQYAGLSGHMKSHGTALNCNAPMETSG